MALSATSGVAGLVAATAGGVAVAWAARLHPLAWLVAISVAAFVGALVGRVSGALLFPAAAGDIQVIRPGPAALPKTLIAATVPALAAAFVLLVLARLAPPTGLGFLTSAGVVGAALVTALLIAVGAARR